jgi:hypothetical protein
MSAGQGFHNLALAELLPIRSDIPGRGQDRCAHEPLTFGNPSEATILVYRRKGVQSILVYRR